MNVNHAVQFQRIFWLDVLAHAKIIIDGTCGNGYDLEFLIKHKQKNALIWAIDIQKQALTSTKSRLQDLIHDELVRLVEGSHDEIIAHLPVEEIDLLIFNLGYLPKGDHSLHTKPETTIQAIKEGLKKLAKHGVITVVAYPGSDKGKIETMALHEFLATLPQDIYDVSFWSPINQKNSPPQLYIIKGR